MTFPSGLVSCLIPAIISSDVVRKGMNGLLARLLEVGMAESADAKLNALVEVVRASTAEAGCNDDGGATPS